MPATSFWGPPPRLLGFQGIPSAGAHAPGIGGGSSERDTTSKGVSCRRGNSSCANGQRLGRQDSRERHVVVRHGACVRRRPRKTRTLARRQPKERRLDLSHSCGWGRRQAALTSFCAGDGGRKRRAVQRHVSHGYLVYPSAGHWAREFLLLRRLKGP